VADARQLEHRVTVQDRVVDEVKRAPVEQGPDVFERAGREVVDGVDLLAALEVGFGYVRADEARAAGDQDLQGSSPRNPATLACRGSGVNSPCARAAVGYNQGLRQ